MCQLSPANAATPSGTRVIAPVVKISAQACSQGANAGGKTICGLGIGVSGVSQASSFVTCLGCRGSWSTWSRAGHGWSARSTRPIAAGASVLLVITKPGYVGRYRLYRPAAGSSLGLSLSRQGCLGAGIPASAIHQNLHRLLRNLPTVPCRKPKGLKAYAFTAGTNELSSSTISHALVYGHASQALWLTIAETSSGNCRAGGPFAYSQAERHRLWWYMWHVKKGEFEEGFRTRALLPAGRFCIYLQTGNLYHGFPDGWSAQWGYTDYATGDVITGPASTALPSAGSTQITLTGDAPRTETLQSYDSLTPCPEYSEYLQVSSFGGSTMQVSGAFTETLTTASFTRSGYICSYLHDGGITVAMSTDQVTVPGTQFKDQTSFAETADQAVVTLSDPVGNAGSAGAAIAAGQTVYVRCILNGMGLSAYDPIWYEVASAPWSDAYYAPAFAFYNNGQTSGPVTHGNLWDRAVPFCNAA